MTSTKNKACQTMIIGVVSLGLTAAVNTVVAQDNNTRVTDILLTASNSATPSKGPAGYTQIGYWDVDGGGSKGTNGSTGHYMMALYTKTATIGLVAGSNTCVADVQLRASSSAKPPSGPAGYTQIGYWDVDAGGSKGTDGSTGHYMMALYAKKAPIGHGADLTQCVTDAQLRASSSAKPPSGPAGYAQIGYWDVDAGGSKGTDGSTGHYMMALYTDKAAVCVEKSTLVDNDAMTMCPTGTAMVGIAGGFGHSSAYNKPHRIRCCPF